MACVYWIHRPDHTDMFTEGYIGFTSLSPQVRFCAHKRVARYGQRKNSPVYNAIRKHGEKLIYKVLVIGEKEYCLDLERKLRPKNFIGWNMGIGGDAPAFGVKPSDENREKMRQRMTGKKLSQESIEKIRQKSMGHKRNVGRANSEAAKEKIRQKALGRTHSEETRKLLRDQRIGVPLPRELREKMKASKSQIVECPHCGKIGKHGGMKKHHFDHCKKVKNAPIQE